MREEKQLLLDEVKDKIENSKGFIVTRYASFTAPRAREFRDKMAEIGGEFEVVKKRVFIKAAEVCGIQLDLSALKGHVGVIFSQNDTAQLAKSALKYSETNENAISILAGRIDGESYSGEDVEALAKLPGLDELRAQFLGLFDAPMAQTVGCMQSALTSVLYCLEEKSKKE